MKMDLNYLIITMKLVLMVNDKKCGFISDLLNSAQHCIK